MIECNELTNKVVRVLKIYEDGAYGPEILIEFADGSTFSACLRNHMSIEAKYLRDDGGEPCVLRDYSSSAEPR